MKFFPLASVCGVISTQHPSQPCLHALSPTPPLFCMKFSAFPGLIALCSHKPAHITLFALPSVILHYTKILILGWAVAESALITTAIRFFFFSSSPPPPIVSFVFGGYTYVRVLKGRKLAPSY